jgi:hypothetical protein
VYLLAAGTRLGRVLYDDALPRTSSTDNRKSSPRPVLTGAGA